MKLGTMVPLIEEKQRAKFRGRAATGWQEPRKQENTELGRNWDVIET